MLRESSVARAAAHSTSPWSSRAAGVPPSPGDNIHFSKHGRNLDSAFTRRETLLLVQPIDLLGDENASESERGTGLPAPGKTSPSPRANCSPTRAASANRSPLGPSSPSASPAPATPLRRLRAQENAPSPASRAVVRDSPARALDECAQLGQPDSAYDELETGPVFREEIGHSEYECENEVSDRASDHADELFYAELLQLDCEPIGAPESDGDDGSDEDNVEPGLDVFDSPHAAQEPAATSPSPTPSEAELVESETAGVSSECAPESDAGDELDDALSVNPARPSFALGYLAAFEDEVSSLDLDEPRLEATDVDESEQELPRLGRPREEHLSDISSLDLDLEMRYDEPQTEEEGDVKYFAVVQDLQDSSALVVLVEAEPDVEFELEPKVEDLELQGQELPPPAIEPPAQDAAQDSPAGAVSVAPDSEGRRSPPSNPSPTPDLDFLTSHSTTSTLDPSPSLDPAPTPAARVATTPSVEDAKRAARLAFAASAPTVKRQLSKQTVLEPSRSRAPARPIPSPLKMPFARPTTVSRLAPRTQSRIAVSAAPKAGPSSVAKSVLPARPCVSRLMQPTATSAARNVVPSSATTKIKLAKRAMLPVVPQLSASAPPPASAQADAVVLPSRPASAASSSSASSLSASGLPKPSTRPGLKSTTSVQSKIGSVRRPLGAPVVAAPRGAASAPPPTPSSTQLIIASACTVPPPSASTSTQVLRLAEVVKATSRLGQTNSAPTLHQPSLVATSPRPLPRPARLASPVKARPSPLPSPARLPRPPPLEVRPALVPRDSPARLPRPPPLSSLANDARSPERARKPHRVGDARIGSENAAPRPATAVPARTHSNPTLPTSAFPGRSPAKARLAAPAPLVSIAPTGPLYALPTASVLTAPAERVDAEIVLEVFRPLAAQAPLPRPKPLGAAVEPEPALDEPSTGRAPRRAAAAATPATPLPRPTRKTLAAAAALREAELLALETAAVVVADPEAAAPARDVPAFTPAPVLTQEQWAQLTQRNTRKNKQHFNKLSVDELVLDENRPPSPTSKIRKSVSGTSNEARKEGREDRAKKRRSALRSSLDGSVDGEGDDGIVVPVSPVEGPLAHFRAAGDDEEYSSPVRGGGHKGKKKSSLAGRGSRRVKWDKALVYEGPVKPHGESAGILKRVPLDKYGNSVATSVGFAKPTAVTIVKRIYLDDE